MNKIEQNASKLEEVIEVNSELKSQVNIFIKTRPVSQNSKNLLSQSYFSKEPKERV